MRPVDSIDELITGLLGDYPYEKVDKHDVRLVALTAVYRALCDVFDDDEDEEPFDYASALAEQIQEAVHVGIEISIQNEVNTEFEALIANLNLDGEES